MILIPHNSCVKYLEEEITMTKQIYRTANGKVVDMGKLMLQNENIRAVGNMGVNAKGDLIDPENRVIATKQQQVQKQYDRQIKKGPQGV